MLAATALLLALQGPQLVPPADSTTPRAVGPTVATARVLAPADTVRRRPRAVEVGEGYELRLRVHRYTAYLVPALFAVQYVAGQKLYDEATGGADAPDWAKPLHKGNALALGTAFTLNTVTGAWNLWETRSQPEGRPLRLLHAASMLAANGIFLYTGTMLDDDDGGTFEQRKSDRRRHRTLALTGMGITLVSGTTMLLAR